MPTFAVGNETEQAFDGDRIRYHRTYLPTTRHIDWIYLMAEGEAVAERPMISVVRCASLSPCGTLVVRYIVPRSSFSYCYVLSVL